MLHINVQTENKKISTGNKKISQAFGIAGAILEEGNMNRYRGKILRYREKVSRVTVVFMAAVMFFGLVFFANFGVNFAGGGASCWAINIGDVIDESGFGSAIDIGNDVDGGVFGAQGNQASVYYADFPEGSGVGQKWDNDSTDSIGSVFNGIAGVSREWYDIVDSEQSRASFETGGSNVQTRNTAEVYTRYPNRYEVELNDYSEGYSRSIAFYDITFSGDLLTAMKDGYVSSINFTAWFRSWATTLDGSWWGETRCWYATVALYNYKFEKDSNGNFPTATFPTVGHTGSNALGGCGNFWEDANWIYNQASIFNSALSKKYQDKNGGDSVDSGENAKPFTYDSYNTVEKVQEFAKNPYLHFVVTSYMTGDNNDGHNYLFSNAAIEAVKLDFTYTGTAPATGTTPNINFAVNNAAYGAIDADPTTPAINTNTAISGVTANSTNLNLTPTTSNRAIPNAGYYFVNWTDNLTATNLSNISADTVTSYNALKKKVDAPLLKRFNYYAGGTVTLTANFAQIPDVNIPDLTYNGTPQAPSPLGNHADYTVVHSYTGTDYGGTDYNGSAAPTNAGVYTYTATLKREGETVGVGTYNFTIKKQGLSLTQNPNANNLSKFYDGSNVLQIDGFKIRAAGKYSNGQYDILVGGLAGADLPTDNTNVSTAILREADSGDAYNNLARILGQTNEGQTTIAVYLKLTSENYYLPNEQYLQNINLTVTIVARPIKVTAKTAEFSKTYDGNTDATLTLSTLFSTYVNAEKYDADTGNPNFYANDTTLFGFNSSDTIDTVFALSASGIYNSKNVSDADKLALLGKLTVKNGNFTLVLEDGKLDIPAKINPLALGVSAQSQTKVYGENDPALTFVQNSDNIKIGTETADFSGGLTRTAGENVDTYLIQIGSLALANDTASGFIASNYSLSFTGNDFEITKRTLTVTPTSGQSKTYGDIDPTFVFETANAAYEETAAFGGALTRDVGENVSDIYNIHIGNLALTDGGGTFLADNYTLDFVSGVKFTVNKRIITISKEDVSGLTKIYDGNKTPAQTASGNLETYLTVGNINGTLESIANSADGIFDVTAWGYNSENLASAAAITLSVTLNNANYAVNTIGNDGFSANYDASVTPRGLTVAVDSGQSKIYGENDPAFSYTLNSDNIKIGSETAAFQGSLTRAAGEDVDTYLIQKGSLALKDGENGFIASNYSLTVETAQFEIIKRTLTVTPTSGQSKQYGDADPTFEYSVGNVKSGETAAFGGALTRESGEEIFDGNDVIEYNILIGSLTLTDGGTFLADNYTLDFVSGVKFTIDKKILTVSAKIVSGLTKTYDGNITPKQDAAGNLETYLNVTGLVGGDSADGIFDITAWEYDSKDVANAAAITLAAVLNSAEGKNYEVDTSGATDFSKEYAASITPLALTVTKKSPTIAKTYDGDSIVKPAASVSDLSTYITISGYAPEEDFSDISDLISIISFLYSDENVGMDKAATLTLQIESGANYSLPSAGLYEFAYEDVKIAAIALTALQNMTLTYGEEKPAIGFATAADGAENVAGTIDWTQGSALDAETHPSVLAGADAETFQNYYVYFTPNNEIYAEGKIALPLKILRANLSAPYFADITYGDAKPTVGTADGVLYETVGVLITAWAHSDLAATYPKAGTHTGNVTFTSTDNNYNGGTLSASLTVKKLTVEFSLKALETAPSKTYDAKVDAEFITTASLPTYLKLKDGFYFGGTDGMTTVLSVGAAVYDGKDVGTAVSDGKKIVLTVAFADENAENNYTLIQKAYDIDADITRAAISVSSGISTKNRAYDGSTVVELVFGAIELSGVCLSDSVGIDYSAYSASVQNENYGTGKEVTVAGLTLDGADKDNYILTQPVPYVDISQKILTVGELNPTISKSYDGNPTVKTNDGNDVEKTDLTTFLDISGWLEDLNSIINSLSISKFEYDDATVKLNKTATLVLSIGEGNYALPKTDYVFHYEDVKIIQSVIVLAVKDGLNHADLSKVYDGKTEVPSGISISAENIADYLEILSEPLADGMGLKDVLTVVFQEYKDKNASDSAYIRIVIELNASQSYGLFESEFEIPAAISKKGLTVDLISAKNKVYDGTAYAELTSATLNGLENGEELTLGEDFSASCGFIDKNAALSVGLTLISAELKQTAKSGNYEILASPDAFGTAEISKKTLTLETEDKTIIFDGYAHFGTVAAKDGAKNLPIVWTDDKAFNAFGIATGIFDETASVKVEISLDGDIVERAVGAGEYTLKYIYIPNIQNDNYDIIGDGAAAVLTVEKAAEETFNEIINKSVEFNDSKRYVYTEGTLIVPRILAMEISEIYGISFVSCDTPAISHTGVYTVKFTFAAEDNFQIDYYTVIYVVEPRPVEFKIERESGKISVVDPVPGAKFRLVDAKTDKVAADWQTSPVFNKVSDNKDYKVYMELQGFAAADYAPDKTEIASAAIRNDLMIWIIVATIIGLALLIWFVAMRKKKDQPRQGPMGMMPFGPTVPMQGFTAPKLPTAPGLKKYAPNNAPKKSEPAKDSKKPDAKKPELKKADTKKVEPPKAELKKAEPSKADLKKSAQPAPKGGQQLVKAKPAAAKKETVPMLEMKFVRNSAHYGGAAKPEKQTIMRDKTERD
jgi:hypothetical protein